MSGKSLQQLTVEAEAALADRREKLAGQLGDLAKLFQRHPNADEAIDAVLAYCSAATSMYNGYDQSIPNAELLGAHETEAWVSQQAQTCLNLLNHIVHHHRAIQKISSDLGIPPTSLPVPDPTAFAQIQRLFAQFYPEQVAAIRREFHELGLPTVGFDAPRSRAQDAASFSIDDTGMKAHGMRSEHVRDVLTTVSRVSTSSDGSAAAGAFKGEDVGKVSKALSPPKAKASWRGSLMAELQKEPVALLSKTVGGLIVAGLIAFFARMATSPGPQTPTVTSMPGTVSPSSP